MFGCPKVHTINSLAANGVLLECMKSNMCILITTVFNQVKQSLKEN